MARRRTRRPLPPRRGPNASAQIASIVFLALILFFILRFKESLALSLSGFMDAFSPDLEAASAPPSLDIPTLPEHNRPPEHAPEHAPPHPTPPEERP